MFEIPKCIAVEQNKNCDHFGITHPPFLLRCFGLSVERFEREREVLFNSE